MPIQTGEAPLTVPAVTFGLTVRETQEELIVDGQELLTTTLYTLPFKETFGAVIFKVAVVTPE